MTTKKGRNSRTKESSPYEFVRGILSHTDKIRHSPGFSFKKSWAGRVVKTQPNKNKNENNIFDHQPTTAFRNGSIQLYHISGGVTPLQDSQVGRAIFPATAGKTARSDS